MLRHLRQLDMAHRRASVARQIAIVAITFAIVSAAWLVALVLIDQAQGQPMSLAERLDLFLVWVGRP